jgi:hypothetical protein
MGMFTWLENIRRKVDLAVGRHYQKQTNKHMLAHRRMACMMATIFPWYEKLGEHVNSYLAGQMDENDLKKNFEIYEFRFGIQFEAVIKGLKVLEQSDFIRSETADRKTQNEEELGYINDFLLAMKFIYASQSYFDKLNKLILSMGIVLDRGDQKKLIKLVEEYMLELKVYQKFCQKYIKKGICEGVSNVPDE